MAGENGGPGVVPTKTPLTAQEIATGRSPMPVAPVVSTNNKIAQTVASYASAHPAGPHQHYGNTMDANGNPKLYWDAGWAMGSDGKPYQPMIPPKVQSGAGGAGGGSTDHGKVTGTQTVTKNGRQIIVTTFEDGTTSEVDYGLSAADQAQQQNWLAVGKNLLEQYGVGSLWNDYQDLILNKGYNSATAMLAMQSLPSWTNRFSANKTRLAQGLPVLDPATYLSTEEKYKDVMISAGIDKSIYSDTNNLGELMAKDISPKEMQDRLDAARFELDNKDPYIIDQLKMRFGLTTGDIVLHMLDPKVAASVISQKVASAKIGAEAARQGLGVYGVDSADRLANAGVSQSQAATGFFNIGQEQQFTQALPGDTSGSVNAEQLANAEFSLSAQDALAKRNVQSKRVAEYQQGGAFAAGAAGASGLGVANAGS